MRDASGHIQRRQIRSLPAPQRSLPRLPSRRYVSLVPTFSKIIAATDFSEDSNLALTFAQELALKFSAEVVVLHVDQPLAPVMMTPELGPAMDVGAMGRIAEEQRMLAQKELDKIAGKLREGGLKV